MADGYKSSLACDCVTACQDTLFLTSSSLSGKSWHGELRGFKRVFEGSIACHLPSSSKECLAISSTLVAVGSDDGKIYLHSFAEGLGFNQEGVLDKHDGIISKLNKITDTEIISASWDGQVKFWDLESQTELWESYRTRNHILCCKNLDENVLLASERSGGTGRVCLYDTRESNVPLRIKMFNSDVLSIDTINGFFLLGLQDGSVLEWDLNADSFLPIRKHQAPVRGLSICAKTNRILSTSDDGFVFNKGFEHHDFTPSCCWWLDRPVTCSWDGTVKIVDI